MIQCLYKESKGQRTNPQIRFDRIKGLAMGQITRYRLNTRITRGCCKGKILDFDNNIGKISQRYPYVMTTGAGHSSDTYTATKSDGAINWGCFSIKKRNTRSEQT